MYTHTVTCMCVCVRTRACGAQRSTSCVIIKDPSILFFETVSHWPGAHQEDEAGWPVSLRDPPVCLPSVAITSICQQAPFSFTWVLATEFRLKQVLYNLRCLSSPVINS